MADMKEVVDGLTILMKYSPKGGVCAEHDIICAAPSVAKDDLSEEDQVAMERLGWHFDEDAGSWARFV